MFDCRRTIECEAGVNNKRYKELQEKKMHWNFSKMIDIFSNESDGQLLLNGKWGLEEEALRVTPDGALALTPHPSVFGDKIVNPYVTTDFSESQMELITPAFDTIEGMYSFLGGLKDDVNSALTSHKP